MNREIKMFIISWNQYKEETFKLFVQSYIKFYLFLLYFKFQISNFQKI